MKMGPKFYPETSVTKPTPRETPQKAKTTNPFYSLMPNSLVGLCNEFEKQIPTAEAILNISFSHTVYRTELC